MFLAPWATLLKTVVILLFSLSSSGCGKQEDPLFDKPSVAPSAQSGRAVLSGVVMTSRNACLSQGYALLQVLNSQGNPVHEEVLPIGGNFVVQLIPGDYTVFSQATPCVFSQAITIALGDRLVVDPVLF